MTFLAGFLVGQSTSMGTHDEILEELPADLRAYAEGMIDLLQLDPSQAEDLRIILFAYERERVTLLEQQMAAVDSEWVSLDQRFESLLAYRILRADQRLVAADLREPRTVAPSPPPR
ncbi:MAG: hypothetical protein QM477_07745 [Planctomycetota bacterium]